MGAGCNASVWTPRLQLRQHSRVVPVSSASPSQCVVRIMRGLSEESPDTGSGRGIIRESSYLRAKFAYTAWFVITFRSLVKMASNRSFA